MSNNLRAIRHNSGKKVREVTDFLGVSRFTLFHYENGARKITLETAARLAKFYGCTVNDFVKEA